MIILEKKTPIAERLRVNMKGLAILVGVALVACAQAQKQCDCSQLEALAKTVKDASECSQNRSRNRPLGIEADH